MKVIHDNEFGGIMMIPLINDWGIAKACQIQGCEDKTTTIIVFTADESPVGKPLHIGICDKHHAEAKKSNSFEYTVNV